MNKNLSKLFAVTGILFLSLFCSCSDDDGPENPGGQTPAEASIEGIWQWTRWEGTEDGGHFVEDYENEEKYQTTYLSRDIYIFESDGTFIDGSVKPGKDLIVQQTGTWSLAEGDTPVIDVFKKRTDWISDPGTTFHHEILELTRDKMVISYVDEHYDTKVTMKRLNAVSGYPVTEEDGL